MFITWRLDYPGLSQKTERLKVFGMEGLLLNDSTHIFSTRLEEFRLISSPKAIMTDPSAL